jgi:hypothetical protein
MTTPDVRVRLSAEGTAEVVAALKKVQAEGEKSARASAKSFGSLNGALGKLKGLLVGLGTYLSARAFIGFISGSAQMVGAANETAQAVGTTTENLSVLQFVARAAGVDVQRLSTILPTFAKNLLTAADGSGNAAKALQQLEQVSPGLRKALRSTDDSVERLAILSSAFAKLPDSATKSALAMQIFGRAGATLVPLMNELGTKGLPAVKKEAREAGQIIDNELSQAVDQATDQMAALRTQAQILGAQFFVGLAPDLRRSMGMISGDLKDSAGDWREYGRAVGEVLPGLVLVFGTAFDYIASGIKRLGQRIAGLTIQTVSAIRAMNLEAVGNSTRAEQEREVARNAIAEIAAEMEADEKARIDRMNRRFKEATALRGEFGQTGWHPPMAAPPDQTALDTARMAADQMLEIQKAAIDNEIALIKAKNALRNEQEKQAFENGLETVRDHYAERAKIIDETTSAEIEALQRKRALLVGEEDKGKRKKEEAAIDAQIAQLQIAAATERLQLVGEEKKAVRDLGEDRLDLERQLLELQGKQHEVAMLDIEAEINAAREKLRAPFGPLTEENAAFLDAIRAQLTAKERFDEALRLAEAGMAEMEIARARVQAEVEAGLTSELEGERQLLAIEQGRIAALEDLARKLLAAAKATGDEDLIRKAEEFSNSLIGAGVRVDDLERKLQNLGQSIKSAATDDLADFFSEGVTEAKNFGDAIRGLTSSIVQSIRRIVSELLAAQIVKGIGNLFGGGGSIGGGGTPHQGTSVGAGSWASGGLLSRVPIQRFSDGGYLRGPGTGTSDSLVALVDGGGPARFSRGEFVVREASASQPGAVEFLEAFNRFGMSAIRPIASGMPRFAEGGTVGGGGAAAKPWEGHLTVGLQPGLVLDALSTPAGEKLMLRVISKNRRAVGTTVG